MSEHYPAKLDQLSENDQLFNEIAGLEHVATYQVPRTPTNVTIDNNLLKGCAANEQEGVYQDIKGVIQAGDELFGIVEAAVAGREASPDSITKFILTRFGRDGRRAQIEGVMTPGEPLMIGRTAENGMRSDVSRYHFKVGVNRNGHLAIEDLNSANGTRLQVATKPPIPELEPKNPLAQYSRWAPKSADVKSLLSGQPAQPKTPRGFSSQGVSFAAPALISEVPGISQWARPDTEAVPAVPQVSPEQAVQPDIELILTARAELVLSLSQVDKDNLQKYAQGTIDKKRAQDIGDGESSIYFGQQAGQGINALSPEARKVANHYLQLSQQLEKIR